MMAASRCLFAATVIIVISTLTSSAAVLQQHSPHQRELVTRKMTNTHHQNSLPTTQTNWAGISNYYLYSCNKTIQNEALNAMKASGLKVLRIFLLSTEGEGAVAACESSAIPDVEPQTVGTYNDTILERLDDLLYAASIRGIKVTVALHDRWSLGCWRSDAYQRKYNLTRANCQHNATQNNPENFYTNGRDDFKNRIEHILGFVSRHTNSPIGQWKEALFSVEAENEAFGAATISPFNANWMCEMAEAIRIHLHPEVLITTGGGGIGMSKIPAVFESVEALAQCSFIDVIALHSYESPLIIDALITGYTKVIGKKRLILQEWGVTGINSTAQANAFSQISGMVSKHAIPQMYWELQPSNLATSSMSYGISPPAPAPSPGVQRSRGSDGKWVNGCTDTSCPTEVWVTALYPASQAAALQTAAANWPEIWSCTHDEDCRYNGKCIQSECVCDAAWRGPSCAALRLQPTPRENGFQHPNSSSWGGSIIKDESDGKYHMFSSFITEDCGLAEWSTNSEIVRATADTPLGPYVFQEVVAQRFAHEPNLVFGTPPGQVMLLATMYPDPPTNFPNCTPRSDSSSAINSESGKTNLPHSESGKTNLPPPRLPAKNTYLWVAKSAALIAKAERQLAIDAVKWNYDPQHNGAVCDTNAAGAIGPEGSIVGLWRHCETENLHTMPHTFTAARGINGSSYLPNISVTVPFVAHAGAEDPMVYTRKNDDGTLVFHAILHDEQITRCADAPVGCWPGGRHAFSTDGGLTWDYSSFDAYNGTVEYTDGSIEDYYLRARPHMLLDAKGNIIALSNGLRPTKASQHVYTLVQPVNTNNN